MIRYGQLPFEGSILDDAQRDSTADAASSASCLAR